MATSSTRAAGIVLFALSCAAGCELSDARGPGLEADAPPPRITVRACGSTTLGDGVLPTLWERFVARADATDGSVTVAGGAYAGLPVEIEVETTSSAEGLAAIQAGTCDLGMFSGQWTPVEGISASRIAKDAILVMTRPEEPTLREVGLDDLTAWYSGQRRPEGLRVLGQPSAHGTHHAFAELLGVATLVTDAVHEDVPGEADPWIWFESAQRLVDRTGFTPVAVRGPDGQPYAAALDTLASGQYPLVRDVHLLTTASGEPPATVARAFVEYAQSADAAEVFDAHYMLHPSRSATAAPVAGRCDPPALIDGARVGRIAFGASSTTPVNPRALGRTLRTSAQRAYDKGGELVVVAYASHAEGSCDVAAERGAAVVKDLTKMVDELAKLAPWGTQVPAVRSVVSGPTRVWGVRAADNQQALIVLVPPSP